MQYAKPVTLNVEECDRLSFLPYLFGNDFLYAEAYVYALAQKMMPEYQGGFWHFIRLPDGGGYMMPDGDRFHMVNGANWFDRTVSADAAGIILTSLVINRQLWLYHDSGDAGLTQLYRMRDAQLWRHIEFHPTWQNLSVSGLTWTYLDGRTLSDGNYNYQVRVIDTAGNIGATASQIVTVDTTAPLASKTIAIAGISDDTGLSSSAPAHRAGSGSSRLPRRAPAAARHRAPAQSVRVSFRFLLCRAYPATERP